MDFYSEFSKYYDVVFPTGKAQLNFIQKNTPQKNATILDIACGTGNYAIALAEKGLNVSAIDLDEEMINEVKEKAKLKNTQINTYVGNMMRLNEYFKENTFDTAFCIGNSLVHLTDLVDMQETLDRIYDIVKFNGRLIIQIINYDRILKDKIDHLPTIESKEEGVKFIRNYQYDEEQHLINFNTELVVEKEGKKESYTNSVPLYPLKSQELVNLLKGAAFKSIDIYGNFLGEVYSEDSYATIVVAEK
ncbi:MAG: class I SAM-dependent methyltransferase [Clostridiaceae bacterium]|nr:class I SAM-dependent methyltransferase [Clostridiaceae bacterium]